MVPVNFSLCLALSGKAEEEVGRQHQGMDRPGIRKVPEGNGGHRKMESSTRVYGLTVNKIKVMFHRA